MQYVCKMIRFNFEPTLRSNKICLYVRHLKEGEKKRSYLTPSFPPSCDICLVFSSSLCSETLNPRKTEFLKNPLFLPAVYAKAQRFESAETQVKKMMIAHVYLFSSY